MRWEDERYVRVYTRDTLDWQALSFDAQGLFVQLLRKVDRAGFLQLGKHGRKGVAVAIGHPGLWERLEPALEELERDGCVVVRGDVLVVRNFLEAQEARQTDAQRKRDQRDRDRARVLAEVRGLTDGHTESHAVTNRDEKSQNVTESHTRSHAVTPSHTLSLQPSLAVPSCAVPAVTPKPAAARDDIAFFARCEDRRLRAFPESLPDSTPPNFHSWWPEAKAAVREDVGKLDAAHTQFLRDDWAKKLKPPCPMRAFISDAGWKQHVEGQSDGAGGDRARVRGRA